MGVETNKAVTEVEGQSVTAAKVEPSGATAIPAATLQRYQSHERPATRPNGASGTRAVRAEREDGVTLIALYHFLLAGLVLLGTIGLSIPTVITGIVGVVEDSDALIATFILGSLAMVTMVLSIILLVVGYGLWTQRQWARVAAIAIGMLSLFGFPIGTMIGGVTIWYLVKPEISAQFK